MCPEGQSPLRWPWQFSGSAEGSFEACVAGIWVCQKQLGFADHDGGSLGGGGGYSFGPMFRAMEPPLFHGEY